MYTYTLNLKLTQPFFFKRKLLYVKARHNIYLKKEEKQKMKLH